MSKMKPKHHVFRATDYLVEYQCFTITFSASCVVEMVDMTIILNFIEHASLKGLVMAFNHSKQIEALDAAK